jgi:hypothetical protein
VRGKAEGEASIAREPAAELMSAKKNLARLQVCSTRPSLIARTYPFGSMHIASSIKTRRPVFWLRTTFDRLPTGIFQQWLK